MSYSISVTDQPENKAESNASDGPESSVPKNDAPGAEDPSSILVIEEIERAEVEAEVSEAHPPIPQPKLKELLESPDPPSRFMTYLSIAFALLAIVCAGTLLFKYWEARQARSPITEAPVAQVDRIFTEPLGEFRMVLKGAGSPKEGELRVDMVAECTTEAACTYLKDHLVQARDIVIPVLVNAQREELLNPDSKNVIRRRITEQLNSLPINGKIIQILFTDLTIEDVR